MHGRRPPLCECNQPSFCNRRRIDWIYASTESWGVSTAVDQQARESTLRGAASTMRPHLQMALQIPRPPLASPACSLVVVIRMDVHQDSKDSKDFGRGRSSRVPAQFLGHLGVKPLLFVDSVNFGVRAVPLLRFSCCCRPSLSALQGQPPEPWHGTLARRCASSSRWLEVRKSSKHLAIRVVEPVESAISTRRGARAAEAHRAAAD